MGAIPLSFAEQVSLDHRMAEEDLLVLVEESPDAAPFNAMPSARAILISLCVVYTVGFPFQHSLLEGIFAEIFEAFSVQ